MSMFPNLCRKMLDSETSKEQKLKELHDKLGKLLVDKEQWEEEKSKLLESLAAKQDENAQSELKVKENI